MEKLEKLCKIILKASHEEIWAVVRNYNKIHLENHFFIINKLIYLNIIPNLPLYYLHYTT